MGKKLSDEEIIGKKFGKLTIIGYTRGKNSTLLCECICECSPDKTKWILWSSLKTGKTKSCGCLNSSEVRRKRATKHGQKGTRLYQTWHGMKDRCNNPNNPGYKNYGERGITVCEEWNNSFKSFFEWAKKSGYEDNLEIERIEVNSGYSPDNCRWTTDFEQARNKRNNIYITYNGETHILKDWATILGIDYQVLGDRYRNGDRDNYLFRKEIGRWATKNDPTYYNEGQLGLTEEGLPGSGETYSQSP